MPTNKYGFEIELVGIDEAIQQVAVLRERLAALAKGGAEGQASGFQGFLQFEGVNEFTAAIDRSLQKLKELEVEKARIADRLAQGNQRLNDAPRDEARKDLLKAEFDAREAGERRVLAINEEAAATRLALQGQISAARARDVELQRVAVDLARQQSRAEGDAAKVRAARRTAYESTLSTTDPAEDLRRKALLLASEVAPGGRRFDEAVEQRRNTILERRVQIENLLARIEKNITSSTPENVGARPLADIAKEEAQVLRLEGTLKRTQAEIDATREALRAMGSSGGQEALTAELERTNEKLARAEALAVSLKAALRTLESGKSFSVTKDLAALAGIPTGFVSNENRGALREALLEAEQGALREENALKERSLSIEKALNEETEKRLSLQNRLTELAQRLSSAQSASRLANQRIAETRGRLGGIEAGGGASVTSAQLREELSALTQDLIALDFPADAFDKAFVGVLERIREIRLELESLANVDFGINPDAEEQVRGLADELAGILPTLAKFKEEGITPEFNADAVFQSLPQFEQLLLGAFRGIGRRFQATLQFALSGALIFSLQKMVREFAQAGIEVQQSFADIGTALEFDIPAPRGTAQFEYSLRGIRDQVLGIASDFKVLPSEVNKAAFQMISRFSDLDAAMAATRAQVLATRVSTIDQSESLRSLTAIAEAYGQALVSVADSTVRQRAQARLYMQVLDEATVIQQEFGVAVEDTLEGAAGAAELYKALGLSQKQLLADVASVVLQSGQSGQAVFDRLQRFVSSVSDPKVQDEILALAAASETLNLTLADFTGDPGGALQSLRAQFPALQAESQTLALQLGNILGQRREADFALAFLSSADKADDILVAMENSAGRAEGRVAILLNTMQGSIDGISSSFQQLAQRFEELGAFSPFALALSTGDALLGLINKLVSQVNRLAGLADIIRLPEPLGGGVGTLVKNLVAALVAAKGLERIFSALTTVTRAEGLASFFKGVRSTKALAVEGSTVDARAAAGIGTFGTEILARRFPDTINRLRESMLSANQQTGTLGKTIKEFFINPLSTVGRSLAQLYSSFSRFAAQLGFGAQVADKAALSELGLARARVAGQAVTVGGAFAAVGTFLLRLISFASSMVLLAIGFQFVAGLVQGLGRLFGNLSSQWGDDTSGSDYQAKLDERISAALSAGQILTRREAALAQATDDLATANEQGILTTDTFAETVGAWGKSFGNFSSSLLALLPYIKEEQVTAPQTTDARSLFSLEPQGPNLRARADIARAQRQYLQAELDILESRIARGAEEVEATGRGEAELKVLREHALALRQRLGSTMDVDDITRLFSRGAREEEYRKIDQLNETFNNEIGVWAQDVWDRLTGQVFELGDLQTASPADLEKSLDEVRTKLSLGQISPEQAFVEFNNILKRGLASEWQALDNTQRQEAYLAANQQARQSVIDTLETNRQRSLQHAETLRVEDDRILKQIEIQKQFIKDAMANESFDNANEARREVRRLERQLEETRSEYYKGVLEFELEHTFGYDARIAALERLKAAITNQVVRRVGVLAYISNRYKLTLDEMRAYAQIEADEAQTRYQQASSRAKLAILEGASTQDNIAAMKAQVAGAYAELRFLQGEGRDVLVIREKLQEIREQEAAVRLAIVERRAAYYKLQAGVGDDMRAAQAEYQAANERLAAIVREGGRDTQVGYEAALAVMQARQQVVNLALEKQDLLNRLGSDLTNSYSQSLLDLQVAINAEAQAQGELEKLRTQKARIQAEQSATKSFYDQRLADLDFLFRTDEIGQSQYIAALRAAQSSIDRTERQGEELWRQIELQIRGMMDATQDAFNIPTDIKLPTLFEVRRALAADALGVNYQDNRQQDINIYVSDDIDVELVIAALEGRFGSNIDIAAARQATGRTGITIGGFN